jgi:3-hydroxypropanoate dehydrogenase
MSEARRKSEQPAGSLSEEGLDLIFRAARTHFAWLNRDVSENLIRAVYDLARMGPTSANCSPARFLFIRSHEAKERLRPHLSQGNVEKTMSAPVTAIIGHDLQFYEKLSKLFPHEPDAKSWFDWSEEHARTTAFRNGTLQGGYFIIAARALGLDCGPMSGFDNEGVDREFFPDGKVKSNFLCNLGYGRREKLFPRSPRLEFDEACQIL